MGKSEQYELESVLYEIDYHGFITIKRDRLYRLLGKGNRAAGTWKALLDVWEGIDGDRGELHAVEFEQEGLLLITNKPLVPLTSWAGE